MKEKTLFYTKLIIVFFVVCWSAMVWQYVGEANEKIVFTKSEHEGNQYNRYLIHIIEYLADHRLHEVMYHSGANNNTEKIAYYKNEVDAFVVKVDELMPQLKWNVAEGQEWDAIKAGIRNMPDSKDSWSNEKSFNYHYAIIGNLLSLMQHASDRSNLILDPEMQSYYLMHINTKVIPYLVQNIAKILDITTGLITTEREVSQQERVEMLIMHGSVNNLSEQMLYGYDVLENSSGNMTEKNIYHEKKGVVLDIQPKFLSVFYEVVVDGSRDISSDDLLTEGDQLIDDYLDMYNSNANSLSKILEERISEIELKRNLLVVFAIAVIYGIFVFYYVFRQNYLKRAQAEQMNIEAKVGLEKEVQERIIELKQQKSLFESIVENIPLAVFAKDVKKDYQWVILNKKGSEIFSLNNTDVIGRSDRDIFSEEQAASMRALDEAVMAGGKIIEIDEEQINTPNGQFIARVVKVPIYDEFGNSALMLSIFEDITERQKSQSKLRMLEAAVENSEDTIIITDTNLEKGLPNIVYVNPAIRSIAGYVPDELVGQSLSKLYGNNNDDRRIKSLEKSLAEGKSYHGEVLNVSKDGREFWTFINIFPVPDEYGNVTNFAAIKRDITREREMRNELIRSKKLAEMANQTKTDFLANMSHELRTPLNSILGMTRMLKESDIDKSQKELVSTVFQSSVNLLEIVNDILDLSKIEAGEVQLENIGFDLPYLLKSTTQAIATLAAEKKLDFIEKHNIDNLPFVKGDPTRLNRIMQNLMGNAIKYTINGYVEVRTSFKEVDQNHIEWICEVNDSGIGIPEDKITHIFDKFTQADISTTRKFGGTGLGLTITKELVELMHGVIEVESELGKGSTFRVRIPFETTDTVFKEKSRRKSVQNTGTIAPDDFKILVAEDHPMNKLLVQKMFERMGLSNFKIVENGIEVLNAIDEKEYDVIFMDCHMPEKNGYDTTEDIRRLEKGTERHIPIVAMTANAMVGDREICIRCGMDDYISKPIDIDELYNILSQWVKFPDKGGEGGRMSETKSKDPVDLSLLDTFTNGDKEMETEFIGLYLTQSEKNIDVMRENRMDGENSPWSEAAHQLKGGSANMGAHKLRGLCEKGQHMLVGTKEQRDELFADIEAEYALVRDYLNKRINS